MDDQANMAYLTIGVRMTDIQYRQILSHLEATKPADRVVDRAYMVNWMLNLALKGAGALAAPHGRTSEKTVPPAK